MTIRTEVGHWALVPSWVRKTLRGQSRALELYVLLADIANHDDNVAQRRRGWLAKEMDCSPDTVDRAMAVLVRVGAVSVERRFDSDGANLASNYLVHQVAPLEQAEGDGRTDAARGEEETDSAEADGDGRDDAARSPRGSGEVAAEPPRGRRAAAAVIDQPPINQPPISQQPPPPVASDVGPGPEVEQAPRRRKAKKEPSHPNYDAAFDVIAQAFGLDPVGLPDNTRGKVLHSRACAFDAGLLDDLQHLADVVWLFRGQPAGIPDIGTFGSACHRIATDPDELRLIPHRAEATEIVAAAIERVPELAGHCKGVTRPQAECAIATALAAGHLRGAVKTAMLTASQWTKGTLLNEVGKLGSTRNARPSAMVPEGLDDLTDRQLVDLLRADPPSGDVDRIGAEIGARLAAPSAEQYRRAFEVRGLIDGREGWPRGMGAANKLRMTLGVTLDQWLAANRPSTPEALTRGA